jgi:polyhydroxyalkanoate synthesis regulator phasin
VSESQNVFERIRARGEEVFGQVSQELMKSPHFVKAVQGALKGKEKLDEAVGKALKTLNVPTRTEFKRVVSRLEALEAQIASLKTRAGVRKGSRKR